MSHSYLEKMPFNCPQCIKHWKIITMRGDARYHPNPQEAHGLAMALELGQLGHRKVQILGGAGATNGINFLFP